MCDWTNPFSNSGNSIADDWLGMNPPKPLPPAPPLPRQRQILRAPTLTGGVGKTTQRRVKNETLAKRRKAGAKSAGKSMLAISRAKGFGMVPIGGVSNNTGTQSGPLMTGVNYV